MNASVVPRGGVLSLDGAAAANRITTRRLGYTLLDARAIAGNS